MDDMILKVKCPNDTKECTVAGGEIMESMVLLGDDEQNMQCLACGYASNKTMKTHIIKVDIGHHPYLPPKTTWLFQ